MPVEVILGDIPALSRRWAPKFSTPSSWKEESSSTQNSGMRARTRALGRRGGTKWEAGPPPSAAPMFSAARARLAISPQLGRPGSGMARSMEPDLPPAWQEGWTQPGSCPATARRQPRQVGCATSAAPASRAPTSDASVARPPGPGTPRRDERAQRHHAGGQAKQSRPARGHQAIADTCRDAGGQQPDAGVALLA